MEKMLNAIGERLAQAEKFFIQLVMALLTAIVVIHIGTRNVGLYVSWTYDVSMLLFAWLVFIGSSLAVREGSHYLIDIWYRRGLVRFRRPVIIFAALMVAIFLAVVVWQGFKMTWLVRGRISGAGEIEMIYYVVSLPVSALLSFFHLIEAVIRDWKGEAVPGGAP